MRDKNKYIEEFLESKLRKSELKNTSGDFTVHLMKRISAENKVLQEERKSERIVKYAIGSFSFLIVAFTVVLGIVSKSGKVTSGSTDVGFDTVQTSNSLLERLVYYVESFFMSILDFLGISISSGSLSVILVVLLVVVVFLIGERLFLRGRFKSSVQLK